ncbi:apolipoprotein N-acyltransferase [Neptuniibacter halophilus]|uniref:apolipoprotein N-acyltransferase n=1 Tax=Neptuniibacter halophilus TaxID=651666 RepID=UPI00257329CC|nr:apolipoprotein N-acyltransferase [Neptuniibacter halophilus]
MLIAALTALLAGALIAPAMAPFEVPYLALLPPALLYLCCTHRSVTQSGWLGYLFGLGFFGSGVSWVYVSISEHSQTPLPIAVILTLLFVAGLALLFALQLYLWSKLFSARLRALGFIGLWIVFEWLRSWLFTGFPWLYLGNAALDTPFANLLPIGGVWLASLGMLLTALCAAELLRLRRVALLLALPLPLIASYLLHQSWTERGEEPLRVALVQPNIPQQIKWNPDYRPDIFSRYQELSLPHTDTDLMLWPETAIPALFHQAAPALGELLNTLDAENVTLISGLPSSERDASRPRGYRIHNSLAILTVGSGIYHKQRLVPFGEYVPVEQQLRGLLDFFNLPMSSFSLPQGKQPLLQVKGQQISTAICYEIAYPELVRSGARQADILLTVSNDTWFGRSIAPAQHMQIARVRALENGRWLIRGTNNGISGLINPQGELVARLPQFRSGVLRGEVYPMHGETPFQQYGSAPVLGAALLLCLFSLGRRRPRNPLSELS